ncbi:MAG TPA: hypothetical protein VHF47_13920 [Acidimicrobiales bacterium]|nr:hypothetical protein [Acidimicrobiales bacterium]
MDERRPTKAPRTAGELRRRLAEMGDPWTVDPRLGDDDPIPDYERGGQREDEIPEESRLPVLSPDDDLDELLKELPPNDPDLRKRWAEEGLLDIDAKPTGDAGAEGA